MNKTTYRLVDEQGRVVSRPLGVRDAIDSSQLLNKWSRLVTILPSSRAVHKLRAVDAHAAEAVAYIVGERERRPDLITAIDTILAKSKL